MRRLVATVVVVGLAVLTAPASATQRNAQDAISVIQTADGDVQRAHELLRDLGY